ncbi:DinB family protein [Nocardioides mangrovicus]|uniref:DinB family protein n=2 Tax=Nocardioides mangrovicus TaxID=2478913 RepID=A0A3L8P7R8_9ACTN|nr:DinB family protein [Nocardioides mangrovicus]
MFGARFHGVDLTGADFYHVDLSGARFRNIDLSGASIVSADLLDVTVTGDLRDVVVNEVDVVPLIEAELNRRDPDRAAAHPTDADGFRAGWELLARRWEETVARARALDPTQLQESVDGEWSFIETQRHLVYASQAWVGRGILGEAAPWHPLSLPWDQAPDMPGVPRDREVQPSLEEVLAVREHTRATVSGVIERLTDEQLDVEHTAPDDGVWPYGTHTVRDCLATVLDEEYEHRRFAERDLARLETPTT